MLNVVVYNAEPINFFLMIAGAQVLKQQKKHEDPRVCNGVFGATLDLR